MSCKIFLWLIVFVLFLFPIYASDINFNLQKDNYKSFETVQLNIVIENITLTKDLDINNLVLQDDSGKSFNLAKNVINIDNKNYYFYFDLPLLNQADYKIALVNVNYIKDNGFKVSNFFNNISVVSGDTQIVSVRPAYFLSKITSKQETSFTLFITNKGKDIVNINLQKSGDFFNLDAKEFNLAPGSTKNVNVVTSIFGKAGGNFTGDINIVYSGGSYKIPFLVFRTDFVENKNIANFTSISNVTNNVTVIKTEVNYDGLVLKTLSDRIIKNLDIDLNVGDYYPPSQIILSNDAGIDLHNIKYLFNKDVKGIFDLQPNSLDFLENGKSETLLFSLNGSSHFFAGSYNGSLVFSSDERVGFSIPMKVRVFDNTKPIVENKNVVNSTVNNATVKTVVEEKSNFNFTWIVLVFFILIFLILIYFFYKKTKGKKDEFERFVDKVKNRRDSY